MSKKIMIKCEEASTICNKNQYKEASIFDKIRLAIHNFLCQRCKLYSIQNGKITEMCKNYKDEKSHTLSAEDKTCMQKKINEKQ